MKKKSAAKKPAAKKAAPKAKPPLAIGCVYYMVKDMGRAVDFYTKTLGLPLVCRYGNDWAEVDAGTTRIGLHPTDGAIGSGGATVSFYVKDLGAVAKRLATMGATMGDIHESGQGKMAVLRDTEGNPLQFTEFSAMFLERSNYPLPKGV